MPFSKKMSFNKLICWYELLTHRTSEKIWMVLLSNIWQIFQKYMFDYFFFYFIFCYLIFVIIRNQYIWLLLFVKIYYYLQYLWANHRLISSRVMCCISMGVNVVCPIYHVYGLKSTLIQNCCLSYFIQTLFS